MGWFNSYTQSLVDKPMSRIEDFGEATWWGAIANFVNLIVGAGIISLSYSMRRTGFGAGVIMYAFSALMMTLGSVMAIQCGTKANKLNFETLFKETCGSWSVYNFSFTVYANTILVCSAYLILVGQSIVDLSDTLGDKYKVD